jgi:hypothetical protein
MKMAFLNSSHKLWCFSCNSLAVLALGCGTLVLAGGTPASYAFAQDAPAASQAVRTDAQIQADVLQKLATAPGLTGQKLTAVTNNGVVTLSGSVTDEVTRQLAENAASGVAGVKSVSNNLTVGDVPAEAAPAETTPSQPQQSQPQGQAQQGTNNGWGPAGPPPDAVNGQIPPQPAAGSQTAGATPTNGAPSGTTYGTPMAEGHPQQGAYPGSGYGYPNQAPARPAYQPYGNAQAQRRYVQPSGPVTIPAGTLLTVRLQNFIDARRIKPGEVFVVNAARDVFENGVLAVPLGATLEGRIVAVKKPGAFSGGGDIQVELSQLDLDGQTYPIATDIFSTQTPGKGGYSAANTIGGAAFGAILGAAFGGGPGAAIGAVAGGATGAAVSSATPAPRSFIPAETLITFHLKSPATIQPVSPDEATRLAASMPRPVLRPRPVYYGPRPVYYGYPY